MKALMLVVVGLAAVAAGAGAFAVLAETQLGGELASLGSRFGLQPGKGGASQLLGVLDAVAPGESDKIKTAAAVTAVGGAVVAVGVYALLREVVA